MFRTTELSDPDFEINNLRFITVKTPNLKGRGDICVFVSPGLDESHLNVPLVILLHGVYGSAWIWAMKGRAHLTAQEMIEKQEIRPMIIAMPSDGLWGDGSGYLAHDGYDFEQWIVSDVPAAVQECIEAVSSESPLFIGGLSMGGFGALRLGCKYPDRFRAVSGHSSITSVEQMSMFVEEAQEHYQTKNETDHSVWNTIQAATSYPTLRFDCGTEDQLIEFNRELHQQLVDAKIGHIYQEFSGGHEWPYWQTHLQDSLRFFNNQL